MTAAEMPTRPAHVADFRAGFEAARAALTVSPHACRALAEATWPHAQHGAWWVDGFCAHLDIARGAYASRPAAIARAMGLSAEAAR